jgi:hypothetical protein
MMANPGRHNRNDERSHFIRTPFVKIFGLLDVDSHGNRMWGFGLVIRYGFDDLEFHVVLFIITLQKN